jgi:hypothetical protein
VIIQCGPRQAAKYRFEYRPNYKNEEMDNISDQEVRTSSLRDKDSTKKKKKKKNWRYSRDSILGICGVTYGVTSEGHNLYKEYMTDPSVWVQIKWTGLNSQDQKKLVRGCSWIPRSEFTRFCGGKRTTMLK